MVECLSLNTHKCARTHTYTHTKPWVCLPALYEQDMVVYVYNPSSKEQSQEDQAGPRKEDVKKAQAKMASRKLEDMNAEGSYGKVKGQGQG